jgi:hypothetical protein
MTERVLNMKIPERDKERNQTDAALYVVALGPTISGNNNRMIT